MSELRHRGAGASAAGSAPATPAMGSSKVKLAAALSAGTETGRTPVLPLIFWLLEQSRVTLAMFPTVFAVVMSAIVGFSLKGFIFWWVAFPLALVVAPALYLVYMSWQHDGGDADWTGHIEFRDPATQKKWLGKKIPMEVMYEAYMAEELDFKKDVLETFMARNQFFRFCFTWGDVKFYFWEFLGQNTSHTEESDKGDIAHVYNRGNDFYNWFLGPSMTYTSGMFLDPSDSLEDAQERKLDTVCKYVQMQKGDKHLDIGCGWGPLVCHAAKNFGTDSTGITLAQEQADWARDRAKKAGVEDKVNVIVDDYRNLPEQKWDKITCLEMAEHVGIKNFQTFLGQVRGMLKDDGIFYLQIAGLRRAWQYEDLVWGLFMGKYIFPGADASCPLGFVADQCERAGFEIHRVENCGQHYKITIEKWYHNWISNQKDITAKYGERYYRMWLVFLAWSVIIGAQGSSKVYMITLNKDHINDKQSLSPAEQHLAPYDRQSRWVGPNVIGTQQ